MKTQIYTVFRSTLMPSGDQTWVQMKPKNRGGEQIAGEITIYCSPSNAPPVGSEVTVEVKWGT